MFKNAVHKLKRVLPAGGWLTLSAQIFSALLTILCALFLFISPVQAQNSEQTSKEGQTQTSTPVHLTAAEKEWLAAHPDEKFVFAADQPPALIIDKNGSVSGIVKDILDILNSRLGTNFGIIVEDYTILTEMMQTRKVAGTLGLAQGMGGYYNVLETEPVYTVYPVIFTRGKTSIKLNSLKDLEGKTISVSKSSGWAIKLLEPFKDRVGIVKADTPLDAMGMLYEGKVDYMMGHSQHAYYISTNQLIGIHPGHIFMDRPIHVVIGVRDDWPILAGIIEKGLASISKKELTAIYNKWAPLPQQQKTIALTREEVSWLAQKQTVRVSSGNFPPFIIRNGQEVSGIVIDYLRLIAQRTGVTFDYVSTGMPFADRLEGLMSLKGPVDLIPCMMKTPERETYLSFSKAYLDTPRMIFTRQNTGMVSGLADFAGKKMAVVRQTVVQQEIEMKYPGIQLLLYDTDLDAMKAVSIGKADAYVGNLMLASYLILQNGFINLTIAAPTDLANHIFSFGSRNDWPQLSSIIDKGMDSITPTERLAIRGKYFSVRYEHGIRPADVVRWILMVAGAGMTLVLMFFLWNRTLKKQVRERTAKLLYHATLLENVSDAVVSHDLDFKIVSWNEAAHQIYGWKAEEVIGKTLGQVLQTENPDIKKEEMLAAVRDTGKWQGEIRQTRKNGVTIDINATVSRVMDGQGNPIGFVGVNRDVTQQKESRKLLIESEIRFRATFEQAAVGIAHVGVNGHFLRVNEKFCDIIGYPRKETLALSFQEITHPDDLNTDLDHVAQLLKGEAEVYSMEKRYVRKQGDFIWVHLTVSLLFDSTGTPLFFVSVIKDISKRKRLQEERDRILNLSVDLICIATMEGRFTYLNPAWEKTLGYPRKELMARNFLDFIHPDDHLKQEAQLARLAAGEITEEFENRYLHKEGSVRHILWVATPMVEEKQIYCIGRNITARKRSDEKISGYQERLKALASKLTIAEEKERRRIAAELHDHIGQTLAFSRIQVAKAKKLAPEGKVTTLLEELSQSLLGTIRDTKDLVFDLSSPLLNEMGLAAAIAQWLEEQVHKKHGLKTVFRDDKKSFLVNDDLRAILFRNVRELLTNVIKHARATTVIVSMECHENKLKLSVTDDGVGFDPDQESFSFHSPSKFGLFSVRERIEDFGGSVEIISAPGRGATIKMTIPEP